eukprot:5725549-Amphidinium_carterae.2
MLHRSVHVGPYEQKLPLPYCLKGPHQVNASLCHIYIFLPWGAVVVFLVVSYSPDLDVFGSARNASLDPAHVRELVNV